MKIGAQPVPRNEPFWAFGIVKRHPKMQLCSAGTRPPPWTEWWCPFAGKADEKRWIPVPNFVRTEE